jgi:tetratricopeptide (TPR) repeat protein
LAEPTGDLGGLLNAIPGQGLALLASGRVDEAGVKFRRSLEVADALGPEGVWVRALTEVWLCTVLAAQHDLDGAVEHAERGLASARRRGDRLTTYTALFNLAEVSLARSDYEQARRYLDEGIGLSGETRDLANLAFFLEALAVVEGAAGRPERLAALLGAAVGLRETVGWTVYGYYRPDTALRERAAAAARDALGDDRYENALDHGRSMSFAEAIAFALR